MFKQTNIIKNLPANTSYMLDFKEKQENFPGFISSISSSSNGIITTIHTWNNIDDHYNFIKNNQEFLLTMGKNRDIAWAASNTTMTVSYSIE